MKLEGRFHDQTVALTIRRTDAPGGRHFLVEQAGEGGTRTVEIELLNRQGDRWTLRVGERIEDVMIRKSGDRFVVDWQQSSFELELYSLREKARRRSDRADQEGRVSLRARMPGRVIRVLHQIGESVEAGQGLMIIEAMKMQNEIRSPKSGKVISCLVREGASVNAGELLVEIE